MLSVLVMGSFPQLAVSVLMLASLSLSGCYHYRVAAANSAPADDGHSATKHALVWGLLEEGTTEPNCQGNGLAEVEASTNFGFVLLSVVTLGVWVPQKLEWKCAKDRLRVDHGLE